MKQPCHFTCRRRHHLRGDIHFLSRDQDGVCECWQGDLLDIGAIVNIYIPLCCLFLCV